MVALRLFVSVTVKSTRLVPNGSWAPGSGVWAMVKGLQSVATIWAVKSGATAVQLFDTWSGELSLQDYQEFALPAVQEVISGITGSVPVIYYTKASQHLLLAAGRSGANVLSVDWRVDLGEARGALGPRIALQGNVDPAALLGPAETIRQTTLDTMNSLAGRGHILNLGHGILPNTPVENAQLFVETGQQALLQEMRPAAQSR